MAEIHRTTMTPNKLELLSGWLLKQPWYRGTGTAPLLAKAGGFRLDDPLGEVGIEVMFVADKLGGHEVVYHVPLSYRGAALGAADAGLVGTADHGVLGRRWIYDGAHDAVAVAQLLALAQERADPQHQTRSGALEPSVVGRDLRSTGLTVSTAHPMVPSSDNRRTTIAVTAVDGTGARVPDVRLELERVLAPRGHGYAEGLPGACGQVEATWSHSDGSSARGLIVLVR